MEEELEFICLVCGKKFKTTDPLQDICTDCACELNEDFFEEQRDSYNKYLQIEV